MLIVSADSNFRSWSLMRPSSQFWKTVSVHFSTPSCQGVCDSTCHLPSGAAALSKLVLRNFRRFSLPISWKLRTDPCPPEGAFSWTVSKASRNKRSVAAIAFAGPVRPCCSAHIASNSSSLMLIYKVCADSSMRASKRSIPCPFERTVSEHRWPARTRCSWDCTVHLSSPSSLALLMSTRGGASASASSSPNSSVRDFRTTRLSAPRLSETALDGMRSSKASLACCSTAISSNRFVAAVVCDGPFKPCCSRQRSSKYSSEQVTHNVSASSSLSSSNRMRASVPFWKIVKVHRSPRNCQGV
mmetsp:Transcript_4230/g.11818  ORF Transcript_4230/g.11818 Transcript_4230/m.11818 type:complete len:300 (-) Transcript_4230:481-1380(-)